MSAIDPAAKIVAQQASRDRKRLEAQKRVQDRKRAELAAELQAKKDRRRGSLSRSEKIIIAEIVQDQPNNEQINAVAVAMRRPVATVTSAMAKAREKFAARADYYVDLHQAAAESALVLGEVGEARKAAEWAIQNISAKNARGEVERIVDKADESASLPAIQIGIALGGLPRTQPTLPTTIPTRDD